MTKRRITGIIALVLAASLLAGCRNNDGVTVVDADKYKGVIVSAAETTTSDHKTIIINDKNTDITSDSTDISDSSDPSETSDTSPEESTEAVPETAESTTEAYTEAPVTVSASPVTTEPRIETTKPRTEISTPKTTPTATQKTTEKPTETTTTESEDGPEISVDADYMQRDTFYSSYYEAMNYSEIKAMWITYIEIQSLLTGKSESEFRSSIGKAFDNCKDLGINTVYIHLRPFGDAMYSSEYFPWSKYVTGSIGEAPDFDPLSVMIDEAHSRKLSIHGYLNPLRLYSDKEIEQVSDSFAIGRWYRDADKSGKYIVDVDGRWYLNPAYDEVINLICNGVAEIVANYNVDGIIIDDYFYPTTAVYFDSDAFMNSKYSTVYSFRIDNCNKLVKSMYDTVKATNSNTLFSVSPAGNVENNKNYYYADVEKWCSTAGYADVMVPQLYFGFENSALPFSTALETWNKMIGKSGVKLAPALAVHKCGETDAWAGEGAEEWLNSNDIIANQIIASREVSNYSGIALYTYNYIFNPSNLNDIRKAEIEKIKFILNYEE